MLRLVQQQGIDSLAPLVEALPQLARLEGLEETSKPQLQAMLRLAPLRFRQSAGAGGLRCHPTPTWQGECAATIIAVRRQGIREGRPTDETRYDVSSLCTGANALIQHIRDRWSKENSWHWLRDVPRREDAQRDRENNGVQILATLRNQSINGCGSKGSGRSSIASLPWLPTTRECSGCWGGGNQPPTHPRHDV